MHQVRLYHPRRAIGTFATGYLRLYEPLTPPNDARLRAMTFRSSTRLVLPAPMLCLPNRKHNLGRLDCELPGARPHSDARRAVHALE